MALLPTLTAPALTLPDPPVIPAVVPVEVPSVASTPREFVAWLDSFPTADHLATWLLRHGIRGRRAESRECPLARLARQAISSRAGAVRIGIGSLGVGGCPCGCGAGVSMSIPLPLVAMEFIARFDHGHYPALIDHNDGEVF